MMNYDALFAAGRVPTGVQGKKVEVGVIGAGVFNHSLIVYGSKSEHTSIRVLCDLDLDRCREIYRSVGVSDDRISYCTSRKEGIAAFESGRYLIFDDIPLAMTMPFDVAVEGTGNPNASTSHVLAAIDNGKHVVMVTKESDSVVGPLLARKAAQNGLIYSLADGDQPALLISLVSWARTAGLSILSIGKASEYDYIYDERARTLSVLDTTLEAGDFDRLWNLGDNPATTLASRSEVCAAVPQRSIADLTEMQMACNHVPVFAPDVPAMHFPIARTLEIADIMVPRKDGGIFEATGRIDVVNCLRRTDEQSMAGGVYVIVACDNEETWRMLRGKGIPVSRNGKAALIYYPAHFLGLESVFSILSVARLGVPTSSSEPRPEYDLIARADRGLSSGTRLVARGHHHEIEGLEGLLMPAEPLARNRQLPFHLADGAVLNRDVAEGTVITPDMLDYGENTTLRTLREEQDRVFLES